MRSGPAFTPRFKSRFGLWPALFLGLLLLFLQQRASAEIWAYVNEQGVAHFAAERLDPRYEIFARDGQGFDTAGGLQAGSDQPAAAALPAMMPGTASKVMAFFEVSPRYKVVKHHLREASSAHEIDYELLQALIATESGFDATAVSPKGAIGLMQLMPATAARFGVAGDKRTPLAKKLSDPGTNIKAGSRYLQYLIDLFPGQLELALAAYNAGEGAVQRAGNKIPNFKETQNYVKTVMQLYTLLKPSAHSTHSADPRSAPARVRMQIPGGATRRGNMISALPSMASQATPAAGSASLRD